MVLLNMHQSFSGSLKYVELIRTKPLVIVLEAFLNMYHRLCDFFEDIYHCISGPFKYLLKLDSILDNSERRWIKQCDLNSSTRYFGLAVGLIVAVTLVGNRL